MSLGKKKIQMQGAAGVVNTDNFAPVLYTGNRGAPAPNDQDIVTGFPPDLVIIKDRDDSGTNWHVVDVIRGYDKILYTDTAITEFSDSDRVHNVDSDSFRVSVDGGTNTEGNDYVSYSWKGAGGTSSANTDGTISSTVSANTAAGFSILNWTGSTSTSAETVGHGLSSAPELVILKNRDTSDSWYVFANGVTSTSQNLKLDTSDAVASTSAMWGAGMTSTVAGIRPASFVSSSSHNVIMYCFHSVDGYQKVGTYTATNPSVSVDVGFPPRFVLLKAATNAGQWLLVDSERGGSSGQDRERLFPNLNAAAGADTSVDFTGNTFSVQFGVTGNQNAGSTYIYLAIA